VLYGFSITGGTGTLWTYPGYAPERDGAGIFMYPSGGRISHNKIFNNSIIHEALVFGVGITVIAFTGHNAIIENNIIHSNSGNKTQPDQACEGGGIVVYKDFAGVVKIIDNKIYNNSLISNGGYVRGAGIYCMAFEPGGKVIISGNLVSDNVIQPSEENPAHTGAGIAMHDIEMKLFNNRILNNRFVGNYGFGGGVRVWGAPVEIYNNIIAGNSAKHGGGIYFGNIPSNSIKFVNNTVIGNTAGYQGGGIFLSNTHPVVLNSILWNNSAPNEPEIFVWQGNITVRYSDVQGDWSGEGNIDLDPQFVAGDPLFHLTDTSPCVNTGADSLQINGLWYYCPPDDYEGDERPYMGRGADMGADETQVVPVGIEPQPSAGIPISYALEQNYPNPFNPSTTIEFSLPRAGLVTLAVYNIVGEKVATLISEDLTAGSYKFQWDARGLASGVYFYRIEAGDYTKSRKMLLIR
jgi:hypothetical protein